MKRFLCVLAAILALNACSPQRNGKFELSFYDCQAKAIYNGLDKYELVVYNGIVDDNLEIVGFGALASVTLYSPNTNDADFPTGEFSTDKLEIDKAKLKYSFVNKTYQIDSCSAIITVEKDDDDNYMLDLSLSDGTKSYYFSYLGALKLTTVNN